MKAVSLNASSLALPWGSGRLLFKMGPVYTGASGSTGAEVSGVGCGGAGAPGRSSPRFGCRRRLISCGLSENKVKGEEFDRGLTEERRARIGKRKRGRGGQTRCSTSWLATDVDLHAMPNLLHTHDTPNEKLPTCLQIPIVFILK